MRLHGDVPPGRDQRGVALITVLAVIAFTALVIGALFGLLSTSMRVTESAERSARESRAADAAIETAINRMRERPCAGIDQPYLTDVEFDQGTPATGDDVTVDVSCSPEEAGGGSDQVRLIGRDGYRGRSPWQQNCSAATTPEGCLPWLAALGGAPTDPGPMSLLHSGHEPLRFASGVSARRGAAALRTDDGGSPAVRVGGQYHQGAAGLGSGGTGCGALAGEPGDGRGQVSDLDDDPTCESDQIDSLLGDIDGNATGPEAPPPVASLPTCAGPVVVVPFGTYNGAQTEQLSQMLDGSQAACRNTTFHFPFGVYAFRGSELRFGDAGSFYVFGQAAGWSPTDGVAASGVAADPDAPLCDASAPGASIVLNGWTELQHTAGRVAVCPAIPATADGSDTQPHPGIFQQPAQSDLVRVSSVTPDPPVTTTSTGLAGWRNLNTPFRCRARTLTTHYPTTTDIDSNFVCLPQRRWEFTLDTDGEGPVNSLRVAIHGRESASAPVVQDEDADEVEDAGGALNDLIRNRRTRFIVQRPNGSELCRTSTDFAQGMPNGDLPASFDLMALGGTCQSGSFDLSEFKNAKVVVIHRVRMDPIVSLIPPFVYEPTMHLSINRVEAQVNAAIGDAGEVRRGDDWVGAQNVLASDGVATPQMTCDRLFCQVPDPDRTMVRVEDSRFVHELELGGFSFPALENPALGDIDPSVRSLRALVTVDPTTTQLPAGWPNPFNVQNFLRPHQVQLELRTPSGARCTAPGGGVNSYQEWSFDLLGPGAPLAPDCADLVLDNLRTLDDVSLTLRFESRCVPNYLNGMPSRCLRTIGFYDPNDTGPVWEMRPPDVQHVRLSLESDTYTGPPPNSLITVNADSGPTGSDFRVFGQAHLPLTDLDLRWRGAATDTAMFGGNLTLNGMLSWMAPGAEMGVVCCSPPESRTVRLTARVGTTDRIVATVAFSDVVENPDGSTTHSPGHGVDVLDWRTCSGDGCNDVVAGVGGNPPEGVAPGE